MGAGENLFLESEIRISLAGKIAAKDFCIFFQHNSVTRRAGGITGWMQGMDGWL